MKHTATAAGYAVPQINLPSNGTDFTLQNISDTDSMYVKFGKGPAVAQENLRLGPGESVSAKEDLPNQFFQNAQAGNGGGMHAITDANDVDFILDF